MFITIEDADSILGEDFAESEAEKKRLVMLANLWCKNYLGGDIDYETEATEEIKVAATEIIKAVKNGAIYGGQDRLTTSEEVKAGDVSSKEEYAEGSIAVSSEEQIAMAILDGSGLLRSTGLSFPVWR